MKYTLEIKIFPFCSCRCVKRYGNETLLTGTLSISINAFVEVAKRLKQGRFLFTGFESRRIPSYPKVNMSVYRYLKLCHRPTVDALSAY